MDRLTLRVDTHLTYAFLDIFDIGTQQLISPFVQVSQLKPHPSLWPFKTLKTDTQGKSAEGLDLPLVIVETDEGETVDWVRWVRCGEVPTVGGSYYAFIRMWRVG